MKKIYDSQETLKAGLKAEQDTIVEYTKYLNLAKENGNEAEVKLWEHIIADEKEHVKEFENALKGDFKLLDSDDDEVIIREKSIAERKRHREIVSEFDDRINDCLVDAGVDHTKYHISIEDPYYYVDCGNDERLALKAYEALGDSFFKCDFVEDEGFYYIRVIRR